MAGNPYGWAHQQARRAALDAFTDGDRCAICGHPMRYWQPKDLDHATPVAYAGGDGLVRLTHASCNRRRGQLTGSRIRRVRSAIAKGRASVPVTSRRARRNATDRNRRRW